MLSSKTLTAPPALSQVPKLSEQLAVFAQVPTVPEVPPQAARAPSPSYVVQSQSNKRQSQMRQSPTRNSQTRHPKTRRSKTGQCLAEQSQTADSNSMHYSTDCPLHVMFSRVRPIEADLSKVHFSDLKEMYEKTRVRRGGISEQRSVDGRVHMMAVYTTNLENIKVYVHRFADILGVEDHIEIPVTFEVSLNNTVSSKNICICILIINNSYTHVELCYLCNRYNRKMVDRLSITKLCG